MQHHSDTDGPSPLATAGLLLLPVLCCGLPLLIASGVLGGLGAALGNPWIIAAAAVVVGVVAWRVRRHSTPSDADCCPPSEPPE